jgi:hypothetical protein
MHILFAALVSLSLGAVPALAFESAYTNIDIEKCRVIAQDRESGSIAWMCPGYRDMELYVAESDLRFFVSAGRDAGQRIAARQTLPPFNYTNNTLEWRLDNGRPFATILRYFISVDDDGTEEQVLVVSKIGKTDSCQIAHVNASRNLNANVLAREAADNLARDFVCGSDDIVVVGND